MPMSKKKCCVPGCLESGNSHKTLHVFPNPVKDRHRFNQWVQAIGGDIIGLENNDIYEHRSVCHAHFDEKFCCQFNRLSNIAVPTLNIPGPLSLPKFTFEERRPLRPIETCAPSPSTSDMPSTSAMASTSAAGLMEPLVLNLVEKHDALEKDFDMEENIDSHKTLHVFPNPVKDRHRFNQWVQAIGGDIIGLENNDIYEHRSVCHAHFDEKFCCQFNRLSNIAVPTLNIPGPLSLPKFTFEERRPLRPIETCAPSPSTSDMPSTSAMASTSAAGLMEPLVLNLVEKHDALEKDFDMEENIGKMSPPKFIYERSSLQSTSAATTKSTAGITKGKFYMEKLMSMTMRTNCKSRPKSTTINV